VTNLQNPYNKQISNRNFLSTTGFKFILTEFPKADFFSNSAVIPSINLGVAIQPTYLKDIPIPGDKLSFDDFILNFLVDEELENYISLHKWLEGLGYPESLSQYRDLINEDPYNPGVHNADAGQSDGTLIVYNSNYNPILKVKFRGLFPVSLSTIEFDAKDQAVNYITAQVTFKYTYYTIEKI
jgi:hypothetical protein